MPTSIKLTPYSVSHELELHLADPYDPTQEDLDLRWLLTTEDSDDFLHTFNLKESPRPWRQLRLQLEASLPEKALDEVLPSGSDLKSDTILTVSVRCPSTKLRKGTVLELTESGRWTGEISVDRFEVRNVIELYPILARRTDLPTTGRDGLPLAVSHGETIGEGRALRIVADESRRPVRGALRVLWEDFRASDHPWRKDHSSDIHFVDLSGDDPTLYLNSRYASWRAALHTAAPNGVDAVIRHLGNALVAQTVWLQLFLYSAGSIELDEELQNVEAPSDWRYAAVDTLAKGLFPELSEEDRLRELAEGLRNPDQIGALLTRAGTIAQEAVRTYRLTETAIRAGERRE